MADRVILHKPRCFYASVENDAQPLHAWQGGGGINGDTEDRHGIVLAKSELAKRAGIKTGMVAWEPKQKCRRSCLLPPQYEQYLKYSALTRSIYNRFTDRVGRMAWTSAGLMSTGSRASPRTA